MLANVKAWFRDQLVKPEADHLSFTANGVPPTLEEVEAAGATGSITALLNYRRYDAERKLYHNLDSVGFVVYAQPAAGLDETQIRTLEGIFTNQYRPGTIIQVSLIADPNVAGILDRWAAVRGHDKRVKNRDVFQFLARRRVKFLEHGAWKSLFPDEYVLIRDYHLVISVCLPFKKGQTELPQVEIDELQRHQDAVIGILRSANMSGSTMAPRHLLNLVGDLLRPSLDPEERRQPVDYDPKLKLNEQMVSDESALYVGRDSLSLRWKDNYVSILPYTVKQFPPHWSGSSNGEFAGAFFNRVQRVGCPFLMTLVVHVPDQVSAAATAKQKLLRSGQMKDTPIGRMVPAWAERHRDWNYVVSQMEQGSKMLQIACNIVLFAPLGAEERSEQSLRNVFASLGWRVVKVRFAVLSRFLTCLPLNIGREAFELIQTKKFFRTMLSWNVVNIAPWIGEWKGNVPADKDPQLVLVGRRGQMCFIDPFENTKGNFNMAVAAASGAGKSFFTQEYVMALLSTGGRSFIFDSGRSYYNLCQILGGQFITFESGSRVVLNPFTTILDPDTTDAKLYAESPQKFADQLPLLKMIIACMADPINRISSEQASLLETAIVRAWNAMKNKASITTVGKCLEEMERPEAHRLAVMLAPYMAGGSYAEYFEGDANIDFSNNLIVLELDDLNAKGDLQIVVLLLLMKRVTEVMYLSGRSQRKVCIIDEAWRLLGKGNAGDFIEEGYRTARKYGGAFMTITQSIPDYYRSPTATAAYSNSDFVFLLRQKRETLAEVEAKGQLVMTPFEKRLYESVTTVAGKYSEIAVKTPDGLAVGLLIVDPAAGKLMSTKAEDVEAIKNYEAQGLSKMEAIDKVAGV